MRGRTFVEGDPFGGGTLAKALTAGGIPVHPPAAWFTDPALTAATPMTVDDQGRVFGHIAPWTARHIGLPRATHPPKSRSKYAFFKTGLLETEEGQDVHVGQLTLAGGHAPVTAGVDAAKAVKHYDDTGSAIADVNVGEDKHGIWVAGALRPTATPTQIRALRASAPSGDWRPINGALELVAVCQVNVPGFPVARACVAGGMMTALVAAGAQQMYRLKLEQKLGLPDRVQQLEKQVTALTASAAKHDLRARVHPGVVAAFGGDWTPPSREKAEKKGQAMKGGSFPIKDEADLKRAIQAFGRAKNKAAAKAHIVERARALGLSDLIPEGWGAATKKAA